METGLFNPQLAGVILVIDDDVDVLAAIQHLLEIESYRVLTAAEPRQGLERYEAHWPEIQVVVLDYHMPGWRGDEVLQRLQQINAEVRVILITGSEEAGAEELRNHGLFGFLQKPFSPAVFLELVAAAGGSAPESSGDLQAIALRHGVAHPHAA